MRTLTSIAALALSLYVSSAFAQTTAPPPAQGAAAAAQEPAKAAAATDDAALTKAVHAALEADPNHFFRHVTVRVDNGVATLGGFVHSSSSIYRARSIAGNVPGITRVESTLQLEPNRPR